MKPLKDTSIRVSIVLIVVSTTALLLLIGFTGVVIEDYNNTRNIIIHENRLHGMLMAEYLVSPLVFYDSTAANEILHKAVTIPEILNAYVYDSDGEMFAVYGDTSLYQLNRQDSGETTFDKGYLITRVPIEYRGMLYGHLYLVSSTTSLYTRLLFLTGILLLLLVVLVVLAFLFASRWQKVITQPIDRLIGHMGKISASHDYTARIEKPSDNEIGRLYEEFNTLLERIQSHQENLEQTRLQVQEQHAQFLAILNAVPENLYVADTENHEVLFTNESMAKLLGGDPVGQACYRALYGRDSECPFCKWKELPESGKAIEWEQYNPTLERHFAITDQMIRWPDGRDVLFELAIDITELKRAEQVLRESESRFRSVIDQSNDALFILYEGRFDLINPKFAQLTGRSEEDITHPGFDFTNCVLSSDREIVKERFAPRNAANQPVAVWKFSIVHVNGNSFRVQASTTEIDYKDGRAILGVLRDVTEQEHLEEQLRQSQKLESIGQLAGGVAHDFNNMLQTIQGNCELAMSEDNLSPDMVEFLEEISNAADRSTALTQQLLAFARQQTVQPSPLDLNKTIGGMLKMIQRLIGEEIELSWLPGHELWQVKLDPIQVNQIVVNLAVNARDAIGGIGYISVETANVHMDEDYVSSHMDAAEGDYVKLSLSDNGCGMDKETLNHIFEPFYTTKEQGKGTGLGLATIYGIVKQNNGIIHVYSEPGEGTTFTIMFPRYERESGSEELTGKSTSLERGTASILIVEDEQAILRLGERALSGLGYTVYTAHTPFEAIEMVENGLADVDVLLTDVVMPTMNGKDFADRLRQSRPGLRVIYMSGYTADIISKRGVLQEDITYIQKPFSISELAHKVKSVVALAD